MSITSNKKFKKPYAPLLPDVVHAPFPYPFREDRSPEESVDRALEEVRAIVEEPYGGLTDPAGIFVEPIQGEGGVVVPPEGFLSGLREIADENDLPLVFDEIQVGMGRTGEWWASEHYDVTPDVMTTAKALGGNGQPLSGTMYHEDLDTWGPGDHAGTYRGHVPAMVGGLRAIEYIQSHDLLDHATEVGAWIRDRPATRARAIRDSARSAGRDSSSAPSSSTRTATLTTTASRRSSSTATSTASSSGRRASTATSCGCCRRSS